MLQWAHTALETVYFSNINKLNGSIHVSTRQASTARKSWLPHTTQALLVPTAGSIYKVKTGALHCLIDSHKTEAMLFHYSKIAWLPVAKFLVVDANGCPMAKYVEHPMKNFTSRTMCRIRQGIIGTCIPSCPACRISQKFQASSSLSPILIGTSISELLSLPPDPHSLAALGWRCHLYNHGIHAMTAPKFRTQITTKHACPNGQIYSSQDIPQHLQCMRRSSSTSSIRKKKNHDVELHMSTWRYWRKTGPCRAATRTLPRPSCHSL